MRENVIKRYESYLDRQIDYFTDYLKVLYFEDIDIKNNNFDDLSIHLQIETEIIEKIKQLSKILNQSIYDFKIKELEKNSILIKKQEKLEELKMEAIECNQKNQTLLKQKQAELPKPIRPKGFNYIGSKLFEEQPQIINFLG